MAKVKKLLTMEELVKFCAEQNFNKFASSESGYTLSVSVPSTFEVENDNNDSHRGMTKVKFRMFHTGLNRNQSYVSKSAAEKAMKTIANRPVLGAIHQLDDGSWDFEGHEMIVQSDEDGNQVVEYIEKQLGSFSSEAPFWEHDDELDKDYVCAYAYIPDDYTKAVEIIKRKNGTKNSVELCIDSLSYNIQEGYLELEDFFVSGSTLLGSRNDGTEITEGMIGSRADIVDFSTENNSIQFERDEKLIEVLDKLNSTLSNFNINLADTKDSKEGGTDMTKFEELLSKYEKCLEDITFEYEGLTDDELEAAFTEAFGTAEPEGDKSGDEEEPVAEPEGTDEGTEPVAETGDEPAGNDDGVIVENALQFTATIDGEVRTFSISLNDKIEAMYNLVNETYSELDGDYYDVNVYEDDGYVEMYGLFTGRCYRQQFKKKKRCCSLVGDRVEIFRQYLSQDEIDELEAFKAKLKELEQYKANKEYEIEHADKMSALVEYSSISDTDEFKKLVESVDKYTKEEIIEKADAIVGKFARQGIQFSFNGVESLQSHKAVSFLTKETVNSVSYAGLFD